MNSRVLCVWLPNWPVQRALAADIVRQSSPLQNHALVLETRDPRRGLMVAAANLAARQAGARIGMRMSELSAICSKSSTDGPLNSHSVQWDIRPYQPDLDLDRLLDLAEQAQRFSPLVGFELHDHQPWHGRSSCEPQALLLEVGGVASLFGGEEAMLVEVAQWLREQHFFAYMAIASSIGASWALCNFEVPRRQKKSQEASQPSPSVGELPECRWLVADRWEEAELLTPLPNAALRIDSLTLSKLQRLGVNTIGQLWQLPRDGLASRLGSQLLLRFDQALGQTEEPIIALTSVPDWLVEMPFETATRSTETLAEAVSQLCQELARRMQKRGQGVLRCVCRLDRVGTAPLVMQLGLFRASDDPDHLQSLLVGQLDQTMQTWGQTSMDRLTVGAVTSSDDEGAVCRVVLQATLTGPIVWEQSHLFDQPDVQNRQHLAHLIDRLSGRLGRDRVLEAQVQRDAEPEQAVSYRPLTGRRRDGSPQTTIRKLNSRISASGAEPRPIDPMRRPTHLLSPPELLSGMTCTPEGTPLEFVYEQQRFQVVHHWGPEQLESGWWRGPSVRRHYYRIETTHGSWWWIFQDLKSRNWFVHGLFG